MGINNDDWNGGHQCARNTDNGADFTVTNQGSIVPKQSNDSTAPPQAYPDLIYGCSNTMCYSSGWPKLVSSIGYWYATGNINTTAETGDDWDANYDLWFNRTDNIGPSRGAELMINFNHQGRSPHGTLLGEPNLGGSVYDVYEQQRTSGSYTWNYVDFWRENTTSSVSHLQLNQFMSYAINAGAMQSSWYWTGIDSGFETWYEGAGLQWLYDFIST